MTKQYFRHTHALAGSIALSASLMTPSASACGGFFCSRTAPVFQAAERIIFAQEGEKVTQIVEVMYEGPSEKFSWILPVPGIPEPDVSSKEVFNLLDGSTAPIYALQRDSDFCALATGGDGDAFAFTNAEEVEDDAAPPVTVLDAGSVGPFDFETISINVDDDPAGVAVSWLEDNGYDVTPETGEVLGPYLANGLNLIAFRLTKGQSTGAIRPIVLEYDAPTMAIPIKPTSVAANDDMPVLVWVLGESRAVPTNYRGLELNELLIDWFNPGGSYLNVVTAAANEAGGQGFVTELVADASDYVAIVKPDESDLDRVFSDRETYEDSLISIVTQLGTWDGFMESATANIQLRGGVTMEEFVTCSYCYFHPEDFGPDEAERLGFGGASALEEGIADDDPIYDTDLSALETHLRATVIRPLIEAGELLERHDKITRLFTTMSANEMTKDPIFEFNSDLEDVSNIHTAVQELDDPTGCGFDSDDRWTITLEDGTKVYGKGNVWPHSLGNTELQANARIVQFTTSGLPTVVGDLTENNMKEHEETEAGTPPVGSSEDQNANEGGCSLSPGSAQTPVSWLAGLGLLGAFFARRRNTGVLLR